MNTLRIAFVTIAALAALNLNTVRADQPHMQNALEHLRQARVSLQHATHNKGGHRLRALANVNRAIAQVEAGIAAGR